MTQNPLNSVNYGIKELNLEIVNKGAIIYWEKGLSLRLTLIFPIVPCKLYGSTQYCNRTIFQHVCLVKFQILYQ